LAAGIQKVAAASFANSARKDPALKLDRGGEAGSLKFISRIAQPMAKGVHLLFSIAALLVENFTSLASLDSSDCLTLGKTV